MTTKQAQRGAISTPVIVGAAVVILILIGIGYYVSQTGPLTDQSTGMPETVEEMMEQMTANDEVMMEESAMMAETTGVAPPADTGYSGQVLAGTSAPLLVFNQADYDQAVAEGKLVVLYFYANWCPICRAEFPKAEAAFDQLTTDQVVGFRVNFNDNETNDNETALARQFGVPYQHTKVFVQNGQQLLKSPEQWTTERYLTEINNQL